MTPRYGQVWRHSVGDYMVLAPKRNRLAGEGYTILYLGPAPTRQVAIIGWSTLGNKDWKLLEAPR